MSINLSSLGLACLFWAALLLLGLVVGMNAPFILAVVGTVLYLNPYPWKV